MKICYLGQQGWLISGETTNILVDPVLTETFGTSSNLRFRIYPPRSVSINKMPVMTAVFITNEHLDHFHLPSLNRLDRIIPIYVGDLMPECVKHAIKSMGFNLTSLKNQQAVMVGEFIINLFIGSQDIPFWEKRVYQLYCREQKNQQQGGVYIQSDTLLSDYFVKQVKSKLIPSPDVFITTNNAQIVPKDVLGAFDNLLPITNQHEDDGLIGLKVLNEIIIQYPHQLSCPKHIVLSGGGYIQETGAVGPFLFSDYQHLAKLANQLSLDTKVHGLLPGQELDLSQDITTSVGWMSLDEERWEIYKDRGSKYHNDSQMLSSKPLFEPLSSELSVETALHSVEDELIFMSKVLICSSLGTQLTSTNEYIDGPTDSKRFVINFRTALNDNLFQYALDLQKGRFVKMESIPFVALIRQFPYGIDIFLEDFSALLDGKIQIWELATANMRQWYLGTKLDSPIAFLYKYFSEQVRQDLAIKVYKNLHAQ